MPKTLTSIAATKHWQKEEDEDEDNEPILQILAVCKLEAAFQKSNNPKNTEKRECLRCLNSSMQLEHTMRKLTKSLMRHSIECIKRDPNPNEKKSTEQGRNDF